MEPLCALFDAAARRHKENQARYAAAFVAAHGAQDIGELSREETRELFAICLMGKAGLMPRCERSNGSSGDANEPYHRVYVPGLRR
jgi:hypothetical protein